MTRTSFYPSLFVAIWSKVARTADGRVLTVTFALLFGFITLSATIIPGMDRPTAPRDARVVGETSEPGDMPASPESPAVQVSITAAFIARAQQALSDVDPITIEILENSVTGLETSSDPAKRNIYNLFAEDNRASAIAGLEAMASAQLDAGDTSGAITTWKEAGALAFLVDPEASVRFYEAALAELPQDPALNHQLGLLYLQARQSDAAAEKFRTIRDSEALAGSHWEAAALGNLGIIYLQRRDLQQAEFFILQSLQLNEKLQRRKATALQHANLGLVTFSLGRDVAAERNLQTALTIFEDLNDTRNVAAVQGSLGVIASSKNDLQTALQHFTQSYGLFESIGNKEGMATQSRALAMLERGRGNRDEAEKWHKQSAELSRELGQLQQVAVQYASLGGLAIERNNRAAACTYWREARDIFARSDATDNRAQLQNWMDQAGC